MRTPLVPARAILKLRDDVKKKMGKKFSEKFSMTLSLQTVDYQWAC